MKRLVSTPKKNFKVNPNMGKKEPYRIDEVRVSVMRGEFIRYSQFLDSVKDNLQELKKSNPKYMGLILEIIELSLTPLNGTDIDVPLDKLLVQLCKASYEHHEALDFTQEVLNIADSLTSKIYLAYLSDCILENYNLKSQFKAAIPCIKYMLGATSNSVSLDKQIEFINALKLIINEKADAEKIAILPKIKYMMDNARNKNYTIDASEIIYNRLPAKELLEHIAEGISSGNTELSRVI